MTATAPTRSRPRHRPLSLPRRPRRWWRDLSGAVAVASIVVVIALWISNQGIQNLDGGDGGLTSIGRLAGLLAADLMLLQVLLMARIPWVERVYGQDSLARKHRWFGFTSFWLLMVHIGLITIGYTATANQGLLGETWSLVTTYPGMLLAVGATGLIIMVVVTSIRAARRRMRYESWHLIHLYGYLGVGLALPHQIWTGADFIDTPWARAYWWTAYIATLASVLVFRLGMPLWRSMRHRLVVSQVTTEAPGVVSVYLKGRALHKLPVRAGQFFLWRFLDGPGWSRAHPYSLSAQPMHDQLRISIKDLGDGSGRVASVRPGTRVLIEGPYGAMIPAPPSRRPVVMFAAGIGITAIRALLDDPEIMGRQVTLLYRIRSRRDAVFAHELDELSAWGLDVRYLEGTRDAAPALDAEALRRLVPDVRNRDAYLCGPVPWMRAVRKALVEAGTPRNQIHAEEFAW